MPQDNDSTARPAGLGLPVVSKDVGRTWVDDVPGLAEKRREVARHFVDCKRETSGDVETTRYEPFRGQLEELFERGIVGIEPLADRVLVRAVLPTDASGGGVQMLTQDSRRLILQQVVAVGPGCAKWFEENGHPADYLAPGDFVWVLVTVADRLATKDKSVRLMTVRASYIASKITLKKPR